MNTEHIIDCPACGAVMDKVIFKSVMVDRCTACEGIWFDHLEKEDLRVKRGSEKIDKGGTQPLSREKVVKELDCPVCFVPMVPTRDTRQTHLVFKKCLQCLGAYMEAGQFLDYKDEAFKEFTDRL